MLFYAFLAFFLVGPFGAVRWVYGETISYSIRFFLILIGMFPLMYCLSLKKNIIAFERSKIITVLFYAIVLILNMLIQPDGKYFALLQLIGVLLWIIIGILIAYCLEDRGKTISCLIRAFILANSMYAISTIIYMLYDYQSSINIENNRLIGFFVGSTVLTEVFFATMLFGFVNLHSNRKLIGSLLISISLVAILLSGVRSASVVSIGAAIILFYIFLGEKMEINNILIRICLIIVIIPVFFIIPQIKESIVQRFAWQDILKEGRFEIWTFGLKSISKDSIFFGKGVRAVFSTDIPLDDNIFKGSVAWHNTWIALIVETGLMGFLMFFVIIWKVLKYLSDSFHSWVMGSTVQDYWKSMAVIVAFRYLLMSLTEMNLYTALSPGVIFFCIIFGILTVTRLPEKTNLML